jgi:hypothetical protein
MNAQMHVHSSISPWPLHPPVRLSSLCPSPGIIWGEGFITNGPTIQRYGISDPSGMFAYDDFKRLGPFTISKPALPNQVRRAAKGLDAPTHAYLRPTRRAGCEPLAFCAAKRRRTSRSLLPASQPIVPPKLHPGLAMSSALHLARLTLALPSSRMNLSQVVLSPHVYPRSITGQPAELEADEARITWKWDMSWGWKSTGQDRTSSVRCRSGGSLPGF